MRTIDTIIIHCSATRPDWLAGEGLAAKMAEIRRWHVGRGFNDIGYHWVIDRGGQVAQGRTEDVEGAHARGYNETSIGVCLIGGHGSDATDEFADHFTLQQEKALRNLLGQIQARHGACVIIGHNDVAAKACPGFKVSEWIGGGAVASGDPEPEPAPLPWWAMIWRAIMKIYLGKKENSHGRN